MTRPGAGRGRGPAPAVPRLIEVQPADCGWSPLAVRVGDVLLIRASGGRVRGGRAAVELWGPLLTAVVGTTGEAMAPEGAPNAVLVRARRPGSATLELFTGDPWHSPGATTLEVAVES